MSQRFAIGLGCSSSATLEGAIRLIESCVAELDQSEVAPDSVPGAPGSVLGTPDLVLGTIERCATLAEAVATKLGLRLTLFPANVLAQVEGVTHHSALAEEKTGTPSVAEAAALAALGSGARLALPRRTGNGCTCAMAVLS
ncbi:MAG TPA: cobalamin biosynthesis protein [Acidobacteriaceae bacterium]|jgi:hypothetical protein